MEQLSKLIFLLFLRISVTKEKERITRKQKKMYYFTVEGQTEKWYLEWLRDKINNSEESLYCVVFDISIDTKPLQRAKKLSVTSRTEIWYLFDFEGDTPQYIQRFNNVLNEMSQANKIGKDII